MPSSDMPMIDCHVHLQTPPLPHRVEEVLNRSREAGVKKFICNGTRQADWDCVLQLARHHDSVIPCLGLHPWFISKRSDDWQDRLEDLLTRNAAGVGEIGLDRWVTPRSEDDQEEVFQTQIAIARRLDRPAMIHCLKAWGWLTELLNKTGVPDAGIVIHGYGGTPEMLEQLSHYGAWFSFAGNILDPRKKKARAAAAAAPADRLLAETDAPDMLPPKSSQPACIFDQNGQARNQPANLPLVVRELARLRNTDVEDLAHQLWKNASRLIKTIRE